MTNSNTGAEHSSLPVADPQQVTHQLSPIPLALEKFLRGLEDLRDAAIVAGPAVGKWQLEAFDKQKAVIDKYVQKKPDDLEKALETDPRGVSGLFKAGKELERLRESKAVMMLMRSLFIGIFSEYDVFIGDLLKAIYESKPDLFKGIKREITLSGLLEFASVDAVKQDMLDKEIDSFRRNSYIEQFSEMETKFEISTLRNFSEWPIFVEFGQRRNLLTHNGGLCSEQYLTMCDKVKYAFKERPKPGDDLTPIWTYFSEALFIVGKVAFMLTFTLWRKLLPDDIGTIDKSMNEIIYELLSRERWKHAAEFGKFGLSDSMCRKTSDMHKRIRVVNTAIGLKQCKKPDDVSHLLESMDWSASVRDFKLATLVLNDKYDEAAEIMRSIGKKGEMVGQFSYHTWPLFQDFRDDRRFHAAYEEIYGVPFIEEAAKEAHAKAHEEEGQDRSAIGSEIRPEEETGANPMVALPPASKKRTKTNSSSKSSKVAGISVDQSPPIPSKGIKARSKANGAEIGAGDEDLGGIPKETKTRIRAKTRIRS